MIWSIMPVDALRRREGGATLMSTGSHDSWVAAWNKAHWTMKLGRWWDMCSWIQPTLDSSIPQLSSKEPRLMCRGCLRWHPVKYQQVLRSGCSCSLATLHYVTGVPCWKGPVKSDTKIHWIGVVLQTLAIHVNIHFMARPVVMQVENTCHSLGCAGFQTPQLTVFGKMGKNGCQSVLLLSWHNGYYYLSTNKLKSSPFTSLNSNIVRAHFSQTEAYSVSGDISASDTAYSATTACSNSRLLTFTQNHSQAS